jgi:hypothetical protein
LGTFGLQKTIKRLGLRDRARKPFKNEAVLRVRLTNAVGDDLDDDVIRDEFSPRNDILDLSPGVPALMQWPALVEKLRVQIDDAMDRMAQGLNSVREV